MIYPPIDFERAVTWPGDRPPGCGSFPRLLCLAWVALLKSRQFVGLPQISDALLTVVANTHLRTGILSAKRCLIA
jgi:hypothetical protein